MKRWDEHPSPRSGITYTARVEPNEIGYLVNIVEAHEGLAVVRTKDRALGIVEFWISPLMQDTFEDFARALKKELSITFAPPLPIDVAALGEAAANGPSETISEV